MASELKLVGRGPSSGDQCRVRSFGTLLEKIAQRISALGYVWQNPSYREVRRNGGARDLYRLLNRPWLPCENIRTVLDVGANEGQFIKVARALFPRASILAFEPNPRLTRALQDLLSAPGSGAVLPIACGCESATMPLHLTRFSPATSLLPPTRLRIPDFPPVEIEDTIGVRVERLDQAVRASPIARAPYLLKIDVQGFEWEVLQGAIGILPDVTVILCEVNAVAFYAEQAGFEEIYSFMDQHNFRLVDIGEPIRARATGEILYFDVAFLKTSAGSS
jgi:FkbM family methyltransferase